MHSWRETRGCPNLSSKLVAVLPRRARLVAQLPVLSAATYYRINGSPSDRETSVAGFGGLLASISV